MKELKLSNINLYTIVMDILYNFWVIVLAFLIGFWGTKTYYGYAYKPTYQSSTTVAVNVRDSNGYITSNITKTIEVAGVFQNIFKSDVMAKIINENVHDFNMANVTAQAVPETNLITISAVSRSPVDSYKTVVAVLENYENVFAENLFQDVYINILKTPAVATFPNNTVSVSQKTILAGLASAAMIGLLLALFSYLRDTVKQENDIEQYVDGSLFGTIYHEKPSRQMIEISKKNKQPLRINIFNPFCSYAFVESINRISTKVEYLKSSRGIKSVLITSVDEHEGKTTVSTNIALNLSKKGYKTVLIDIDLRRPSVYKTFDPAVNTTYNEFGNYLLGKAELEDIIKTDTESGLRIIDGKNSYQFAFELLGGSRFSQMLKKLQEEYDYIIIDSPPMSLTADAENIIDQVDASLLIVRQDKTFIAEINDTIDLLTDSDAYFAGCILNDYRTIQSDLLSDKLPKSKKYDNYGAYYYSNT